MNKIEKTLINKCGIYIIFNLISGKRYVGSSSNIYNRLHEHVHCLNNNKAHNQHLQSSWNKYGEDAFIYNVLEYCTEELKFEREQYYIDLVKPEYNLTLNVVANTGHACDDATKEKISNTLKEKYSSGQITTYKQQHNWVKTYIYNIKTFKLEAICNNKIEALRLLKVSSSHYKEDRIYHNRYCITTNNFETKKDLVNYINKNLLKANSIYGTYIITDNNGKFNYYKTLTECARDNFSSKSTLSKHNTASKDNPYIIKQTSAKFYYSNVYIEIEEFAVPIEKSSELLSGNIGGKPEKENTEINTENKSSVSSYSVESEPI